MSDGVGILGTGVFLPPAIRRNDWWPASITGKWEGKLQGLLDSVARADDIAPTEGTRAVMDGLKPHVGDPFQGAVERRVMDSALRPSDMEVAAAKQAIARAGIDPQEIDLVLSAALNPDHLAINNAAQLHDKLKLNRKCLPIAINAMCSSFCAQLSIVQGMLGQGQIKYALLTQSSAASTTIDVNEPFSAWLGDGATAVVVGRVSSNAGILASCWRTDSDASTAMVDGVPGKNWYDDGRIIGYVRDKKAARRMIFSTADTSREVLTEALSQAGLHPQDVTVYASHQSAVWLRKVTQGFNGLQHARFTDTFPRYGSLSAANIPLQLHEAVEKGQLGRGDVVAIFGQGSGTTSAGVVIRWDR